MPIKAVCVETIQSSQQSTAFDPGSTCVGYERVMMVSTWTRHWGWMGRGQSTGENEFWWRLVLSLSMSWPMILCTLAHPISMRKNEGIHMVVGLKCQQVLGLEELNYGGSGEPMVEIKNLSVTKTGQNHQCLTRDSLDYQISSKETILIASSSWLNNADPETRNFAIERALALFLSPGPLSRCWRSSEP
jgi:hypothetical protein